MGEERGEELALDIFKENVSTVEDGEVRGEELLDSGGSKKLVSQFVNEDETEEQEEAREQVQVQERIQVLLRFFYSSGKPSTVKTGEVYDQWLVILKRAKKKATRGQKYLFIIFWSRKCEEIGGSGVQD